MNRLLSILFLLAISPLMEAQVIPLVNVSFDWVKQMGGRSNGNFGNYGTDIAIDNSGNIYTIGDFTATADFDPGPGEFNLSIPPGNDEKLNVYILKLTAAGEFAWAKQIGGTGGGGNRVFSSTISLDNAGNVYLSGTFSGTNDFDPGQGSYTLTSFGDRDIFVVKLNEAGNFVWAKQLGGNGDEQPGVATRIDGNGNIYLTGGFPGTVDFDPGPGIFNLTTAGSWDIFFVKLDTDGDLVWARQAGGTNEDVGVGLDIDIGGNVYVTGVFHQDADFDPGPSTFTLSASGAGDIFVCKLNAAGNFAWAKQIGGTEPADSVESPYSLTVDADGNAIVTGNFANTITLDPGSSNNSLTSLGSFDIFLAKYNAAGNLTWVRQIGGTSEDAIFELTTDASGNIFAIGQFRDRIDIDPGLCKLELQAGGTDVFMARFNVSGNLSWGKQLGRSDKPDAGTGVSGSSIAVDATGNVLSTGGFGGTVDFDPGSGIVYQTAPVQGDVFIHKMRPCTGSTASKLSIAACSPFTLNCQTYTTSGVYTQVIENTSGCDSTITLQLTIRNQNASGEININACSSYEWNGHVLTSTGSYTDTFPSANGCDSIITLHLTINSPVYTSEFKSICQGQQFEGHSTAGTYIDTMVTRNGCDSIRQLELEILQSPAPSLGPDKVLCTGDSITLTPGRFDSYRWQDGSANSSFVARLPGTYGVTVTNLCGSATEQVVVVEGQCEVRFPTAFSPNNDGINESFKVLGNHRFIIFQLQVYNRWGQKIFESAEPAGAWNGKCNGRDQAPGLYTWTCTYTDNTNTYPKKLMGTILLVR